MYTSKICPCPLYDHYLTPKSNLCPQKFSFLSSPSHFCPLFGIYVCHNSLKNWWTKTSQKLDLIFYIYHLVTLQLDKQWTISGFKEIQCLSIICPSLEIISKYIYITVSEAKTNLGQILEQKSQVCPLYGQVMA